MSEERGNVDKATYPAIIGSLKSPLSVFVLAMLVCNAVFSMAAAFMKNLDAFIYSIHTFLAIVFAFIAIAIWSPRSLYHPAELAGLEQNVPEIRHSKFVITLVILLSGFSYAGYQMCKFNMLQNDTTSCERPAEVEKTTTSNKAT